ncbi:MAG: hypothetical protein IJB50_02315 [Clostridia bacterium]|nr:hypothetical protein [Clostridia bacterium]
MSEESDLLATLSTLLSSDDESKTSEDDKKSEEQVDSPFDLGMMLKLGSVFSELNTDDERARLLRDLKPFLSAEKRDKVEQTIKILKLLKIAEKAKNENLL